MATKVDITELREAVKAFNDSGVWEGILERKLTPIQKFDVLKERFMEAVEMIPEEKEDDLPDLVIEVYNALVDMEEEEGEAPSQPKSEPSSTVGEVKKPKRGLNEVLLRLSDLVSEAKYTKKQIVDILCQEFPDRKRSTIQTYVSDNMNEKYTRFDKVIRRNEKKILVWAK